MSGTPNLIRQVLPRTYICTVHRYLCDCCVGLNEGFFLVYTTTSLGEEEREEVCTLRFPNSFRACSHLSYEAPLDEHPNPVFFLFGYQDIRKVYFNHSAFIPGRVLLQGCLTGTLRVLPL
jgi:hypothetical protein